MRPDCKLAGDQVSRSRFLLVFVHIGPDGPTQRHLNSVLHFSSGARGTPISCIELHGYNFYTCLSILHGCHRILKGSFSNRSKSYIVGKYERNRYKFKLPKTPASATWAQTLSSGAMHDRIYGPICGSIHHHGAAFGGPPLFWIPWWWMLPHMGTYILSCMAPELNGCARVALAGA